jgi:glycosyltransferase involved in cell wall biosynthesis
MTPDISYIVSAYDRPESLSCCLHSIRAGTHQDFEIIVTDNAVDKAIAATQRKAVADMRDHRVRYLRSAGKIDVSDCYWSAEYGARQGAGKWLCFPCDDCYYFPRFGAEMLCAAVRGNLDFVECWSLLEMSSGRNMEFKAQWTIKSAFLIRADLFWTLGGFPCKPDEPQSMCCDRVLGERARGAAKGAVLHEVLVVHN